MDVAEFLNGIVDTLCKSLEQKCLRMHMQGMKMQQAVRKTGLFYTSRSPDGRRLLRMKKKAVKKKVASQLSKNQLLVQRYKTKDTSIKNLKEELIKAKEKVTSAKRANTRYIFFVNAFTF